MSEVRPIHLPGSSALSVVRQRTHAALAAWVREWVSGSMNDEQHLAALNIESAPQVDLQPSPEFEGLRGANGQVWFRRCALDRLTFGRAVAGADEWIADITGQSWTARNRALCEALMGAPVTEATVPSGEWPASLSSVGSGAVTISCEPLGLEAIADAGVWSLVPPTQPYARLPTLVPLDRAAQAAHLQLEVMLGSVELELPKLMGLCRGDVLRVPGRLDQPLTVSCEGAPFARAVLGEASGRKSIQITDRYQ